MKKIKLATVIAVLGLTACAPALNKPASRAYAEEAASSPSPEPTTEIICETTETTIIEEDKGTPLKDHPGYYIRGEGWDTMGIYDENGKCCAGGFCNIQSGEYGTVKVSVREGMADSRVGLLNKELKMMIYPNMYSVKAHQYGDAFFGTSYPPAEYFLCNFFDKDGNRIMDISQFIIENAGENYDGEMSLWAAGEVCEALEGEIIPRECRGDYQKEVTRKEFCDFAVNTYIKKERAYFPDDYCEKEKPFSDVDDKNVAIAYSLGIVTGTGGGKFSPDKPITRQEAAVMLNNLAKILRLKPSNDKTEKFVDEDHFADWAYDSIYDICSYRSINSRAVMSGKGEGKFSPWNYYTREEAAATMIRLFKCGFDLDYRDILFEDLKEIGNSYKIGHYRESLLTTQGLAPYFEKWDKLAETDEQKRYIGELKDGVENCMRYYAKVSDYINEYGGNREALEQTVNELRSSFFEQADGADPVDVKINLYMTSLYETFGVNGGLARKGADKVNDGEYLKD